VYFHRALSGFQNYVSKNPSILPRFDREAQERLVALFRRCPPLTVIAELDSFAPPNLEERPAFEKLYGWALYEAGDYAAARVHLFRALHAARPRSSDRAMVRGLLGESYLRTGRLDRADAARTARSRRFRRPTRTTIFARDTSACWVASIAGKGTSRTRSRRIGVRSR
jgi:hypothetical protein